MILKRPIWSDPVIFGLTYFAAAELGIFLSFLPGNFTSFCPPSGVFVSFLLLSEKKRWLALLLAAFPANLASDLLHHRPAITGFLFCCGNCLEGFAGAWLARRCIGHGFPFSSLKNLTKFVGLSAFSSPILGATVGATVVTVALGTTPGWMTYWTTYWATWQVWWSKDVLGVLVVAPVILSWAANSYEFPILSGKTVEALLLLSGLALCLWVAFGGTGSSPLTWKYLVFPFLIWAAVRFGIREVSAINFAMSGLAIWASSRGYGEFAVSGIPVSYRIISLQAFLGVAVFTGTIFAAIIAERTQAKEKLRLANSYNRSLIEASPDPMVTINPDGKISDVNTATENATGYSRDILIGTDFSDYFTEPEKAKAGYQLVFMKEKVRDYFLEIRHRDGKITPVIYNASVYRDQSGAIIGVFAAARDITVRRRIEQELIRAKEAAEAASRSKGEFISHVSHELRTPLNGILGYTQILNRDHSLTDKQREEIDIIHRSAEHLLMMINDLLDLSKIEAGKLEPENDDIHLPEFLKTTADIAEIQARQKGIAFVCEVSPDLPAKIRGDEKRLRQVLLNLLGNAIKFTEKGSVRFEVSLSFPEPEHVLIRFRVRDTGIGIRSEYLDKIFEPFYQVNGRMTKSEGTGLGLAICRRLVRSMGSELHAESIEGQGSTFGFEVKLPRVTCEMVQAHERKPLAPESEHIAAPPKEELLLLSELLRTGDVSAIREYAEKLRRPGSEFAIFGEKVYEHAKNLRLKKIKHLTLRLLETYS